MNRAFFIVVAAASLLSTPAWAATDALAALDADACKAGVLDNDTALRNLGSAAGIGLEPSAFTAYQRGHLGDYAIGQAGKPYRALVNLARDLVGEGRPETPDFRVTLDSGRPDDQNQRAIDFLNNKAPWLHISCVNQVAGADSADKKADDGGWLIVGSQEDAAKAFDEADPASLSWKRDQRARTDETSVSLFVGYDLTGDLRPYVAFQKNTGDEPVNDLTFGAQFLYRPALLAKHRLTIDVGWETDDRFDSSVFRAGASVPLWNLCGRPSNQVWGAMCTPIVSLDYLDVADPGDKTKLVDGRGYGRYGGSFDVVYWRYFGGYDGLKFTAKAGTVVRRDFDGDEGNAQMSTVSLGLSEKDDRFGVSVEWSRGRDLSSFEASDQVMLKLTYKQGSK